MDQIDIRSKRLDVFQYNVIPMLTSKSLFCYFSKVYPCLSKKKRSPPLNYRFKVKLALNFI